MGNIDQVAINSSQSAARRGGIPIALDVAPEFLEQLPLATYACDAGGRLLWFNARAVDLWGRTPRVGDHNDKFGGFEFYSGGRLLTQDEAPMACVLRTGKPVQGLEGQIERPDGTRLWVMIHVAPVKDENGRVVGAINCFHETTAKAKATDALSRRSEERAALHEFTARLQHAGSGQEICDLAIAAAIRALDCTHAAVLLLDEPSVVRSVSGRGVSAGFRCAIEGYSPWQPDTSCAQPICFHDIERADLPAGLIEAVKQEGIGALAFFPLEENGKLLGRVIICYEAPHDFISDEIALAFIISRQLAFSLERRRADRAAQQLAAIVESSEDAIASKDLNGILMTWNRGAERLFGYTAEEVIGKPVTILMPPERVGEEPGILARIRRGEPIAHYETVRRRKDGSLIDVSLSVSPIRDAQGRIVGASKIARDITRRKQHEAEVRESRRRLQELLSAIPAAIYTTDAEGRITYYNEAAVELAGRRPTLGSDQWCVTWKLYWPDGTPLPHDQCPMAVALKEGRPIRGVEAIAERPDGTRIPFIPYPTPLRDSTGKIVGGINMLADISERKQAESQQSMLMRELNHRVKNNMQMLQSLLYSATRRTRSPEARAVLEEASSRISAMAAAQRVLYGTSDAEHFDAGEFLDAVCNAAQQTLPRTVKVVCQKASGELSNDAAMPLALILNELLTNAAKHGVNGSGEGVVRVGLTNGGAGFELYVEDDGPGFELDEVCDRSSGLQLVRGLARQLGATFEVTRHPVTRCSLRFS